MPANTIIPAACRMVMFGLAEMIEVVMMSEARTSISLRELIVVHGGFAMSRVHFLIIGRDTASDKKTCGALGVKVALIYLAGIKRPALSTMQYLPRVGVSQAP